MTDDELEQRLRAHYAAIESRPAPAWLSMRIADALEQRAPRPSVVVRAWPTTAAVCAVAAIVAVALALGLRPGGFLATPGGSPSASPYQQQGPVPSATTISPAPSASAGPSLADASVDLAGTFPGGGLWAIEGSSLLVSTDAGATWRHSSIPATSVSISGVLPTVFVLDPEHAWSITPGPGSDPKDGSFVGILHLVVHRTNDGGQTWQASTIQGNYAATSQELVFVDAKHGYLLCSAQRFGPPVSTVLRTDDGGATWSIAGTSPGLGSMFAVSGPRTLWAGAEAEAGPVAHPILDVSFDGGQTWQDAGLPGLAGQVGGTQAWLAGPPLFSDVLTGMVAVDSSDPSGNSVTGIYRTIDGGRSWSLLSSQPHEAAAGVVVFDAAHWLLPVDNPIGLLASADGGSHWQAQATSGLSNGGWIVWIAGLDGSHAVALVPGSNSYPDRATLFLTGDGGATWQPTHLGASLPATSPTPSTAAVAPTCSTSQLEITVVNTGAAAGTVGGYLRFVNGSDSPCRVHGWPTIVGVSASGATTTSRQTNSLLTFPDITIAPTVTLDPRAVAYAAFAGGDNPGLPTSTCPPPFRSLQVTPPGNTEPVSLSAWNPGDNQYLPNCAGIEVTMVVPASDLPYLEPSPRASAGQ